MRSQPHNPLLGYVSLTEPRGIEEDSRKCFILTVGYHGETTVLPIIKEWIALGNRIISDCWKSYVNVEKHGYTHETVNDSNELVNKNGEHTNKIGEQWIRRQNGPNLFGASTFVQDKLRNFMRRSFRKDEDLSVIFLL